MNDKLWAVSAYFNPIGYNSRFMNFQMYRSRIGVPLAVAELSFGKPFTLKPRDADLLLQFSEGDIMWQKERLINMLIEQLPDSCEYVAIADADILFPDDSWVERSIEMLKTRNIVFPFTKSHRLFPFESPETYQSGRVLPKTAFVHPDAKPPFVETGLVWVVRRELLQDVKLYDSAIVGGADRLMMLAARGDAEMAMERNQMGPAWRAHYKPWADRFYATIDGKVGCLDGDVYGLWHGAGKDRSYYKRHVITASAGFSPQDDIELSSEKTWLWASDKPRMRTSVENYFRSRMEDGRFVNAPWENGERDYWLNVGYMIRPNNKPPLG